MSDSSTKKLPKNVSECTDHNCPIYEEGMVECDDCCDGRFIERVFEYASTCDECGELTMNEDLRMDPKTQLGYCESCAPIVEKRGIALEGAHVPIEDC